MESELTVDRGWLPSFSLSAAYAYALNKISSQPTISFYSSSSFTYYFVFAPLTDSHSFPAMPQQRSLPPPIYDKSSGKAFIAIPAPDFIFQGSEKAKGEPPGYVYVQTQEDPTKESICLSKPTDKVGRRSVGKWMVSTPHFFNRSIHTSDLSLGQELAI